MFCLARVTFQSFLIWCGWLVLLALVLPGLSVRSQGAPLTPHSIEPVVASFREFPDLDNGLLPVLDIGDRFGSEVVSLGDLNGDGTEDLAISAPLDDDGGTNRGAVYIVFLEVDYSVQSFQKISHLQGNFGSGLGNIDIFGSSLASLGDLDGDGVPDLAVGTQWDDDGGSNSGAVYILYLNRDGTVKSKAKISRATAPQIGIQTNSNFGFSLAVGAQTATQTELVIGARGHDARLNDSGAVYFVTIDNAGSVLASQLIDDRTEGLEAVFVAGDNFGDTVETIGDVDDNGTLDLAVMSNAVYSNTDPSRTGVIHLILLNSNKTVSKVVSLDGTNSLLAPYVVSRGDFGAAIEALGDLDGDGVEDLAVGIPDTYNGGDPDGVLLFLYLNSNATLKSLEAVKQGTAAYPTSLLLEDGFGESFAQIVDPSGKRYLIAGTSAYGKETASTLGYGGYSVFEISDRTNQAPVLEPFLTPYSVEEGRREDVFAIQAVDPDAGTNNGGATLGFALEGEDAGAFEITPQQAVRFLTPPDFETPRDADGDNVYAFDVRVSDDGQPARSVTQAVQIVVTNDPDEDGDGVEDVVEQNGLNGGDANDDGTPDYTQSDVVTIATRTNQTVVLDADGCGLEQGTLFEETELADDPEFAYPEGLLGFVGNCPEADLEIFAYDQTAPAALRRLEEEGFVSAEPVTVRNQTINGRSVQVYAYSTMGGTNNDALTTGPGQFPEIFGLAVQLPAEENLDDNQNPPDPRPEVETETEPEDEEEGVTPVLIRTGGHGHREEAHKVRSGGFRR